MVAIFSVVYPILSFTFAAMLFHGSEQPFSVIAKCDFNKDMVAPSPGCWYRLTNMWTGNMLSLDVVNDDGQASSGTLRMAETGNFTGQEWRIVRFSYGPSPPYVLYTNFLGPGMRLDVYINDKTKPRLAAAGRYTGQVWTLTHCPDGTWKLTNEYSGSGLFLDVDAVTTVPFLEGGDRYGQHWTLTPIATFE